MNFYDSWWYLFQHKMFQDDNEESMFEFCLVIQVVKVNPKNNTIEDDESLNTKTRIWLECGEYQGLTETNRHKTCHDIDLDTGGDTFEEAIINLAKLVKKHYD